MLGWRQYRRKVSSEGTYGRQTASLCRWVGGCEVLVTGKGGLGIKRAVRFNDERIPTEARMEQIERKSAEIDLSWFQLSG